MGTWMRKLMWAGAFWACAGVGDVRAEDPISAAAKATFNSIGRQKSTESQIEPTGNAGNAKIETVGAKQCADDRCPAVAECEEPTVKPSKPSILSAWLSSKSTSCECKGHPTPYRPPLYTWFPCKPNVNWTNGCAPACERPVVIATTKHIEQPLRMPDPPSHLLKETPLVPGSSTAIANNQDGLKAPPPPIKKNSPAWLAADPKHAATTKR